MFCESLELIAEAMEGVVEALLLSDEAALDF